MGTITINVKEGIEHEFRETVKQDKGLGKGKLGEAITEAMQKWIEEKRQKMIAKEMLSLMKNGFSMGKLKFRSRDELYDR